MTSPENPEGHQAEVASASSDAKGAPQLTKIRNYVKSNYDAELPGAGQPEQVLERLSSIHERLQKLAFRLMALYVACVLFYLVRLTGLRVDVTLFDQRIFEVPYGMFVFCIVSQVLFCVHLLVSAEARMYQRYVEVICEMCWPARNEIVRQSYIGRGLYGHALSKFINSLKSNSAIGVLFGVSIIPVAVAYFAIYISPLVVGLYYLIDWRLQIVTGAIDLQFYAVAISSASSLLLFIFAISIHAIEDD